MAGPSKQLVNQAYGVPRDVVQTRARSPNRDETARIGGFKAVLGSFGAYA
jgi:hypothetical protein